MSLSEKAIGIYNRLYIQNNETSYKEVYERVSKFVSLEDGELKNKILELLYSQSIIYGSPIMMNAGYSKNPQNSACFVGNLKDDLISIFDFDRECGLIYKEGSGIGINYGVLRETNAELSSGCNTSGPFAFIRKSASTCWAVKSGGKSRRAAFMCMFFDDHPDIIDFINFKRKHKEEYIILQNDEREELFSCMNFSVAISNKFMNSVKNNEMWNLIGVKDGKIKKTISAKEMFSLISYNAHNNGDPGVWFIDIANENNTLKNSYSRYITTNACLWSDTLIFDGNRLVEIKDGGTTFSSWETGMKKVVKLRLSNGKSIILTPDHVIQDRYGNDIQAIDSLNKRINDILENRYYNGEIEIDEDIVLLGFLYGDGYRAGGNFGISVKLSKEREPDVFDFLISKGFHYQKSGQFYVSVYDIPEKINDYLDIISQNSNYKIIPKEIMTMDVNFISSFLCGLYSANGSAITGNGNRISYKTTSKKLAEQVQILNSLFGICSYITTSKEQKIKWENGTYISRKGYNVDISNIDSLIKFQKYVGFIEEIKNEKLDIIVKNKDHKKANRKFPKVTSIQELKFRKKVYDFTMKDNIPYNNANGIIVHNCGELALHPYQACALSAINLGKCVLPNKKIDWDFIKSIIQIMTESMDNTLDISGYPTDNYKKMAISTRPIGNSIMGVADFLIQLEIPYNSQQAYETMLQICNFITKQTILTSSELAVEKGVFELYEENKEPCLDVVKNFLNEEEFIKVKEQGLRNSQWTTCAPQGTTSIACDCSSGIEPLFAICYDKKLSDTNETWTFVNYLFESWLDKHISKNTMISKEDILKKIIENNGSAQGIKEIPNKIQKLFVTAHDIHWSDRIKMQSYIQKGISSSISSTINLPNNATIEEIEDIYMMAFDSHLKGVTIYRDGCREWQPINFGKKKEMIPDEVKIFKNERPIKAEGTTYKVSTPHGNLYITLNKNKEGKPIEIFLRMGKQGAFSNILLDTLSRVVSNSLQGENDIQSIIRIFREAKENPFYFKSSEEQEKPFLAESIVDAIGILMEEEFKDMSDPIQVKHGFSLKKCPSCGKYGLDMGAGCKSGICLECGFSACG